MKQKNSPNFDFEKRYNLAGNIVVAGVDEVGRGALAGPIVAAAVVFKKYENIIKYLGEIDDSKKITPTKRLALDEVIKQRAADYAIGSVGPEEIDHFGIGAANVMAFHRALKGLKKCDFVLIDGRSFRGFDYKYACLPKGESKSISIAAASIIAKVYRDAVMQEIHDEIFRYDFASNKGYGSSKHLKALEKFGSCKHHRKSFLSKLNQQLDQKPLFNV